VEDFLSSQEIQSKTKEKLRKYWKLIKLRASGHLKTNAKFMRDFILSHPEYKKDSRISELLNYELIKEINRIQKEGEKSDLFTNLTTNKQ